MVCAWLGKARLSPAGICAALFCPVFNQRAPAGSPGRGRWAGGQHYAGAGAPHPVGPGLGAEIDQHRDAARSRAGTSTTLGHAEDPPPASPLHGVPPHASCNQPKSPRCDTKMPFGGGKKEGIPKKKRWHPLGSYGACPAGLPQPALGGTVHPQKPPRVSFVPHSHGLPVFWDYHDSCRALPLPTGLAGIPEILLPSGKRKKKLIASSTRSSPTVPWGWRNRRGAELVGLSPWSWPQAGSGCGGCGGCFWGAGRGHAAADGDPTRGLGG